MQFFFETNAMIIVVSIVNPWLLIPSTIMTGLFLGLRMVYVHTSRCLNRIESTSRSPVFSHVNATIQGLSTVRAFSAQQILCREYYNYQDKNTGALYLFFATSRAFALWLDLICVTYIGVVTMSFLSVGKGEFVQLLKLIKKFYQYSFYFYRQYER